MGALTALLLGAVAVAQRDLKQLLAASTSAQLGFVVMSAGLATVSGGAAHLVAHAGEEGPAQYIVDSLDMLDAQRIDHGLRSRTAGGMRRWPGRGPP